MKQKFALLLMFLCLGLWTAAQAQTRSDNDKDDVKKAQQDKDKDQAKHKSPAVKLTNGPVVESAKDNSATIAWSTNVPASTILKYGTDPNNLDRTAEAPWGGTTHRVQLKNLKPGTTYYYRVESTHAQGTGSQVVSNTETFKTQGTANASNAAPAAPASAAAARAAAAPMTEAELTNFDQFLDEHKGIRAELTQNPSLAKDPNYLAQHPQLAQFLNSHEGVKYQLQSEPAKFMQQLDAFANSEDQQVTLRNFRAFLNRHRGIQAQLTQNPNLVNDPNYLRQHPELAQFLATHRGVQAQLKSNPRGFMQAEASLR